MEYQSVKDIVKDLEERPIEKQGNIYHRIPFPEFEHLKTSSEVEGVEQKWKLIRSTCADLFGNSFAGKRILDVGANGGLYTFSLAQLGAEVVAFEPHERYAPIGKFLANTKNLPVTWHPNSYEQAAIGGQQFEVGLLLSVFQWMCRGNPSDPKALADLRHISQSCQYLFFELGFNSGASCIRTSRKNHYAYLIDYLRSATDYRYYRFLMKTTLWRSGKRFLVLCSNDPAQDESGLRRWLRSVKV